MTILTGIKPTGVPHIGNYLGCIKEALNARGGRGGASSPTAYFFIADYHALTSVKSAKLMNEYIREIACTWLACGLDPQTTTFYRQSAVPEIFELSTIIGNVTPKGLMDRAHAFKAAKDAGADVNIGLFTYPVLMSADILAFDTDLVPVGEDQKQHIEIAQDIAGAFNAIYGKTLKVPQPQISKSVAVIPGLDGRKMSKSYGNTIPLFCDSAELLKCIKKITTDSTPPDVEKPADHLIFQLYRYFTGKEMERKVGWGDAKTQLHAAMDAALKPMRDKYNHYMAHYAEVEKILADGAERARSVARQTLARVRKAVGV